MILVLAIGGFIIIGVGILFGIGFIIWAASENIRFGK